MLENLQDLENEWAQFTLNKTGKRSAWTQDQRWRADNPKAYEELQDYREGGPRPVLPAGTGSRMVFHIDAYLKAKGGVVPPSTGRKPNPPVGPFKEESGDHFYRDGDGLLTEKLFVTSAPGYGIGNMRWPYTGPSSGVWVLRDCKVKDVSRPVPGSADGTAEAGFWIGEKTQGERLESWNSAWMEMFTGAACQGSRFIDVDLHDNRHVGLYMEHVSRDVEFRRSSFGGSRFGVVTDSSSINVEWWYEDTVYGPTLPYNNRAGSFDCKFIDCEIYCPPATNQYVCGAFLDAGTFGFVFENCRFHGPGNALGFPNKRMNMATDKQNKVVNCVFDNAGTEVFYHDNVIG